MAAITAQPREKRKALLGIDADVTPSPHPPPKRARYEASPGMDDEAWESSSLGTETDSLIYESPTQSLGSLRFSWPDPSVAETSATSRSTSKRPKKYVCTYEGCGKAFDRPIRLETHKRSHTNERPYKCEEAGCDKTFLRNEHLKRHMQDKHSDARLHVCTYDIGDGVPCRKSFTTATRLRRHIAAHEVKEETTCTEPGCGKIFRKQDTLQRHIRQEHLHEKAYKCSHVDIGADGRATECQRAFAKSAQLKTHVEREHDTSKRYFCDICLLPSGGTDEEASNRRGVAPMASEPALVGFTTYTDLQQHVKAAHPPTCTDCGQQCESNRALKAHIDIEHTSLSERQQFKCTWTGCGRGFTKAGNLKVHMQNVHAKARNFVCGTFGLTGSAKVEGWNGHGCGSAFGTKANLEEHIRTQHLGIPAKIKPCRLNKQKKRRIKTEDVDTASTLIDVEELSTSADMASHRGALSMLTGFGYQEARHIPCLVRGCQFRFTRNYDLATHLELTHRWHIDDVNDRMAEKQALEGGQFWVGRDDSHSDLDERLRQRLESEIPLFGVSESARAGHEEVRKDIDNSHQQIDVFQQGQAEGVVPIQMGMHDHVDGGGITINGMLDAHGDPMILDPALAEGA